MPTHPGRPASAKPGKSSGGWSRATPPARRPRDETQSAGYARRRHLWTIADVGSIPTVSTSGAGASACEPAQRRPRRRVGGRELDEPQVGMARRRRLQVMEDQAADARMPDGLRADLLVEHLVARPPRAELLAALLERLDQGREVRVAD